MYRNALAALAGALLTSACALEVSFDGSRYACEPPANACPDAYECGSSGFCEPRDVPLVDAEVPADVALLDDGALPPDARPGPPDAAVPPPPDASVPLPPDANVPLPPDANVPPTPTTVNITASRDTQLFSPQPTFNFGNFLIIRCALESTIDSPVLLGFPLTTIPTQATVQSAVLHISTSTVVLSSGSVSIYKLNEDWTEGTRDGTAGEASYNRRKANTNWIGAGASGGSRASSASASFSATSANTTYDVNLPASLVQGWVTNPTTNFGLVMTCPFNQAVELLTRATSSPPKLTVTYVP